MIICEDCIEMKYCPKDKLNREECEDFHCRECLNRKYYIEGTECNTCDNTWDRMD